MGPLGTFGDFGGTQNVDAVITTFQKISTIVW